MTHSLLLPNTFGLFYGPPSPEQGQTRIWSLVLICGVLSLSGRMLFSTSSSKASTSDLFFSNISEFPSNCDPLAQVTGLRQCHSPAISSGFICGTTIRKNQGDWTCGNCKLWTWVLFHPQCSVTAFVPSLIHFYSTWLILPEELLWGFKSKMVIQAYVLGDTINCSFINLKVFGRTFLKNPLAFSTIPPEFPLYFQTFFPINMGPITESKTTICLFS